MNNNRLLRLSSSNAHFALIVRAFTIICSDGEQCFRLSFLLKHTLQGHYPLCCLLLIEQGILLGLLLELKSIFHSFYLRLGIFNGAWHPLGLYHQLRF